jgi:hypothetical protein
VNLTVPADDLALIRREQLCTAHPALRISGGTGHWQALISEPSGMTVITRYQLGELLDRVEVVLAAT